MGCWLGLAVCAWAGGCADVRTVAIEVVGRDGAPVLGAHVLAVRLETGTAPLPVNDATMNEIGTGGKTRQQAWTDARGIVVLRLAGGRAHLVQANPPMFSSEAERGSPPARYRLDAEGASLEPIEQGASWAGELRVIR